MQARNLIKTKRCPNCGCLYEMPVAAHNQKYCHIRCKERGEWGRQKQPRFVQDERPFTSSVIRFREEIFRDAPARHIGYKLYSVLLQLWLPLPGLTKRYRGEMSSLPYYPLDPFEAPKVPFVGSYEIVWIQAGGREVQKGEIVDIDFAFEEMKRSYPAIQKAIKLVEKPAMIAANSPLGLLPASGEGGEGAGPIALLEAENPAIHDAEVPKRRRRKSG